MGTIEIPATHQSVINLLEEVVGYRNIANLLTEGSSAKDIGELFGDTIISTIGRAKEKKTLKFIIDNIPEIAFPPFEKIASKHSAIVRGGIIERIGKIGYPYAIWSQHFFACMTRVQIEDWLNQKLVPNLYGSSLEYPPSQLGEINAPAGFQITLNGNYLFLQVSGGNNQMTTRNTLITFDCGMDYLERVNNAIVGLRKKNKKVKPESFGVPLSGQYEKYVPKQNVLDISPDELLENLKKITPILYEANICYEVNHVIKHQSYGIGLVIGDKVRLLNVIFPELALSEIPDISDTYLLPSKGVVSILHFK